MYPLTSAKGLTQYFVNVQKSFIDMQQEIVRDGMPARGFPEDWGDMLYKTIIDWRHITGDFYS